MDTVTVALVAPALDYPRPGTAAACRGAAAGAQTELAAALEALAAWLEAAAPGEPEEVYTRLFDLSPVCTLHAGYHLFGEAYQRGSLLAGLAEELRTRGIDAGEELPDYLPTLLKLLPRLSGEDRQALGETLLLPALAKMATALDGNAHPWAGLIRALPAAVTALLPEPPVLPQELAGISLDAEFPQPEAANA